MIIQTSHDVNPIRHGLFGTFSLGAGDRDRAPPPNHNFVVVAPMATKFDTAMELDVLYTLVTNLFVSSSLLRNYDVIIRIYEARRPKI